jgi:hypothetical protein
MTARYTPRHRTNETPRRAEAIASLARATESRPASRHLQGAPPARCRDGRPGVPRSHECREGAGRIYRADPEPANFEGGSPLAAPLRPATRGTQVRRGRVVREARAALLRCESRAPAALPSFALHAGSPPPVGRDLVCDARAAGRRPGVARPRALCKHRPQLAERLLAAQSVGVCKRSVVATPTGGFARYEQQRRQPPDARVQREAQLVGGRVARSLSPRRSRPSRRRRTIAFDGRRSRDVANRDDRFGYPLSSRGTTALATKGSSGMGAICGAADDPYRPNGGVHVGLALARIQLIGEQAILKRGSPGAPRLTALGLDREAARRARQRVSARSSRFPFHAQAAAIPRRRRAPRVTAFGQNQQPASRCPF